MKSGPDNKAAFRTPTVEVRWKWHYSFPTLALWIVLLLSTLVPKRNREERIWPILITPLIAEAMYELLSWNITASNASNLDMALYLFITLAMAWSAVWIFAPWTSSRRRFVAILKQFVLMLLLGLIATGGYLGFSLPDNPFLSDMESDRNNMMLTIGIFWCFASGGLVGNSYLVSLRRSPERLFRPMRRMLWTVPLLAFGVMALLGMTICLMNWGFTMEALSQYARLWTVAWLPAILLGGFMYLLNVPICLSSYRWPAVKERWFASFPIKVKEIKTP